jgi:hypothetical protein
LSPLRIIATEAAFLQAVQLLRFLNTQVVMQR